MFYFHLFWGQEQSWYIDVTSKYLETFYKLYCRGLFPEIKSGKPSSGSITQHKPSLPCCIFFFFFGMDETRSRTAEAVSGTTLLKPQWSNVGFYEPSAFYQAT